MSSLLKLLKLWVGNILCPLLVAVWSKIFYLATEGDTGRAKCYLIAVRVTFNKWLSFGNALLLVLNIVREHICLFVVSNGLIIWFSKSRKHIISCDDNRRHIIFFANGRSHIISFDDNGRTFFHLMTIVDTLYHVRHTFSFANSKRCIISFDDSRRHSISFANTRRHIF